MNQKQLLSLIVFIVLAGLLPARAQTNQFVANTNTLPWWKSHWQTSVALGFTITRGNSQTALASATATTEKKWGNFTNNDLILGAEALYGSSKIGNGPSQQTADSDHGYIQYNHLLADRFYGYTRLDALRDGIADINYRITVAPGAGYYFIKSKTMDLSGEVGPGFISQKLDDSPTQDYLTLRLAEKFHYTISPHAKCWETVELLPQVDNLRNYIVNAELGIEASLTKNDKLALRAVLDDTYNNVPASGRLKNDMKLITSIVYKF